MGDTSYAVAIVVDTEFGDRLLTVAKVMPVWIVDTPVNRSAAARHWRDHPNQSHTKEVTTFKFNLAGSPSTWCSDILSTIDLHHGPHSHDPAYTVVDVYGAMPTADLRAAFAGFGFTDFSDRIEGFRARIPPAA